MAERAPCSACPQAASSGDMSRLEQLLSEDAGVVMKAAQSGEPGVRPRLLPSSRRLSLSLRPR